ncbi:SA1362 family protein [Bacillaceae bacterium W0354]
MRQSMKYIVFAVLGLAVIGLLGQLFTNPGSFFKSILMMVGFAVIIGVVFYYLIFARGQGQQAKYRKAVKQSKKKYGNSSSSFQPGIIRRPERMKAHATRSHLKVIKGNKK